MRRMILHKILHNSFYSIVIIVFTIIMSESLQAVTPPTSTYLSNISAGLETPARVAIGHDGKIYVTDPLKDRIQVYTPAGSLKYTVENFNGKPVSIAVDANGSIYVGDGRTKSVMVFDSNWQYVRKLGNGDGEFGTAGDIAVSGSTGKIYVVDSAGDVVKIYNSDGTFNASIGSRGSASGQFKFPTGITVDDTNSEIWVADQANYRVQLFSLEGVYKSEIIISDSKIQGLTVDSLGRLYVVDTFQGTVYVYDRNGVRLSTVGSFGERAGELFTPIDTTIDSNNRLFITSSNSNNKVVIYGIDNYTIPVDIYALTVSKSGAGSGTVVSSPAGVICGSSCGASYEAGTPVSLSATAAADSVFSGWSGACSGTGGCAISIDGDKGVTATFALETTPPALTLNQPQPSVLTPPNGKMIAVLVSGTVSDAQSGLKSVSYAVADEYNQYNSTGSITQNSDGSFSFSVSLQASVNRKDSDGKRIYTITITAADNANNTSKGSVTVTVPRK